MRILLANDDGIDSPGLEAMRAVLENRGDHEVWVVAPDGERSGMSHYITLKEAIKARQVGHRRYAISGSPADCVSLAVLGIMAECIPEVVVSGINLGPNLGTDVMYSGTAAAARQAAFMGIPGIACSMASMEGPWYFEQLADFVAENLDLLVKEFDGEHFLNLNAPNHRAHGFAVTYPCYRRYNDRMIRFRSPRGSDYWFVQGDSIDTRGDEGSDWQACSQGLISLSPIHLQPQPGKGDQGYLACRMDQAGRN